MTSSQAQRSEQQQALELLRSGRRFLLTGHQRPDGDVLGAQTALGNLLLAMGREVVIVNPDPAERRYDYLEGPLRFGAWDGGALPEHDVCVMLDFSELSRTAGMAPLIQSAPSKKLVIDHHLHHGAVWWDAAYVDVRASATGLLVHRIARELRVELPGPAMVGVFTSLVTDTGWFKYSNTDAETLRVAGEALEAGVPAALIYDRLFQQRGMAHTRFVARILGRTEYFVDGRLAVVDQPLSERFDTDEVDSDEVLDILRSVRTVEVVLFVRELSPSSCKVSARSKTDYDVNQLVRRFGGGGHRKASGATLAMPLAEGRAALIQAALEGFEGGFA
ncbi:MAG: Bifunctional oligoribonuclease and phosphatase NrnA [Planctomycetota bacterium]|jgi:phosphoesterase RecJ-like protein